MLGKWGWETVVVSRRKTVGLSVVAGIAVGILLTVAAGFILVFLNQRTQHFAATETILLRPTALTGTDPPPEASVKDTPEQPGAMDLIVATDRWLVIDPATLAAPKKTDAESWGKQIWSIELEDADDQDPAQIGAEPLARGPNSNTSITHIAAHRDLLETVLNTDGCIHVGVAATAHNERHGEILFVVQQAECDAGHAKVVALKPKPWAEPPSELNNLNSRLAAFSFLRGEDSSTTLRALATSPTLRSSFETFEIPE